MNARRFLRELFDGFERNDLLTYASAIAFQILTAIVPFLLFAIGLLGFLELGGVWRSDLGPDVEPRVSRETFALIDDTVTQVVEEHQLFWMTGGFLLALWQVSGAVRAVMGALDNVYDSRTRRSFRHRYLLSMWLSIAVAACLVAAFCMARFVPLVLDDLSPLLEIAAFVGRWAVAVALVALAVGLLAHFAPGVRRPLPWVTFGTGLVIAGWIGMSIGFGVYLSEIADYESIFGHLATVIVAFAYLYAAAVVFLGGLQTDAIVRAESRRRERAAA
jgi:membrane protein